MMSQNAIQAYSELNGTMFHGRMFHVLPAKSSMVVKLHDEESIDSKNNFKDKKLKDLKKNATSSHNWNSLFIGANAVSDAIAKNYGKSKEEVFESSTGGSGAAVRLANPSEARKAFKNLAYTKFKHKKMIRIKIQQGKKHLKIMRMRQIMMMLLYCHLKIIQHSLLKI